MNTVKDYLMLTIFALLIMQNALIIINILFAPKWMAGAGWLSFPAGNDRKLRQVLYCLFPITLFAMLIYLR